MMFEQRCYRLQCILPDSFRHPSEVLWVLLSQCFTPSCPEPISPNLDHGLNQNEPSTVREPFIEVSLEYCGLSQ